MFRSAASLIAKKTAIVAITGVTVIGGATLALAEIGAPPDPLTGACPSGEVLGADGLCEADPNAGTDTSGDPVNCEDPANAEHDDCLSSDPEADAETETDLDGPAGEHPENHGKAVSEAARGVEGSPCEGMTGREKGQCVANVATGGKKAPAEAPAAEEETTTEAPAAEEEPVVTEDPEPAAEEPVAETQTAPAEKPAKGNAGGNGKGKGKA